MKITKQAFVMIWLCAAVMLQLQGQSCVSIDPTIVRTDSDMNINFMVAGISNDDLSSADQCVESIDIAFSHSRINNLAVDLISPNGDRLQLIGPQVLSGNFTGLLKWEIGFIQCSEEATPDIQYFQNQETSLPDSFVFSPQFQTIDKWSFPISEPYNGSYYPFGGCLDDFNTGSVNGIWTIQVSNAGNADTGLIESITINFCDETGIECQKCDAEAGEFINSLDTFVCDYRPDLVLDFMQPQGATIDDNFAYNYVIADRFTREILDIQDGLFPDLSGFEIGRYEICGISYALSDSSLIAQQSTSSIDQLADFLTEVPSLLCASITNECTVVELLPVNNRVSLDTVMCSGDIIFIDGELFTDPISGFELRPFGAQPCDSSMIVNLSVMELDAVISLPTQDSTLTCDIDSLVLSADMSGAFLRDENNNTIPTDDFEREWIGPDGEKIQTDFDLQIKIGEPGMYKLVLLNSAACMDVDSVMIIRDIDEAQVDIMEPDFLSCEVNNITLQFNSTVGSREVLWTGPSNFESTEESPEVSVEGMYFLTLTAPNGCPALDSVLVEKNSLIPQYEFEITPISCLNDGQLIYNDGQDPPEDFSWDGPEDFISDELSPVVNIEGEYRLITSLGECVDTQRYQVELINLDPYSIEFEEVSLDCRNTEVQLIANVDRLITNYQWFGPDDFITLEDTATVSQPGKYILRTLDENNCPGLDSFELRADTLAPAINISGRNLGCTEEQVNLIANVIGNDLQIQWTGPSDFESGEILVPVSVPGLYNASVVNSSNGCTSTDSFFVSREEPFQAEIVDDIFDCDLTPLELSVEVDIVPVNLRWSGPSSFTSTEFNPIATIPGEYILTVEGPDQCEVVDTINLDVQRSEIELSNVDDDVINCDRRSVQLSPIVSGDIVEAVWTTPSLESINQLDPNVDEPGTYLLEVIDENNCRADTSLTIEADTIAPTIEYEVMGSFGCNTEEVIIDASNSDMGPNFSYLWTTNSGTVSGPIDMSTISTTSPATYTFNVVNFINRCTSFENIEVEEIENGFLDATLRVKNESCPDQMDGAVEVLETIGAALPISVSLDNELYTDSDNLSSIEPGQYTLFIKDANGCVIEKELDISEGQLVDFNLGEDIDRFSGEDFTLGFDTTGLNISDIEWIVNQSDFANNVDSITLNDVRDIDVMVNITIENSCQYFDDILVRIDDRRLEVYSPNIFSPGTENNGLFRIYPNISVDQILEFIVFDRWGNKVYEQSNMDPNDNFGWDGKINGQSGEIGVYGYVSKLRLKSGEIETITGDVTLIY